MFKNFSPVHGIIIALGGFMVFIVTLIVVFPIGKQNADLISHNYYEDELVYQEVIDAKNLASKLAQKPTMQLTTYGIKVQFPKERVVDLKHIDFLLFRTDDSTLDITKEVTLDENNSFIIPRKVLNPGSYTLKVKWNEKKILHQLDFDVLWK